LTHKEVVSGHPGLPRDTSGDDDDVSALESALGAVVRREETGDLGGGRNVREIRGDLGSATT
jgi:hypothetical protein